jgi:hypothetical protein
MESPGAVTKSTSSAPKTDGLKSTESRAKDILSVIRNRNKQ